MKPQYEYALQLWQRNPIIRSLREEAVREAKRLKQGWCKITFIRGLPNASGKVGAMWFIDEQVLKHDNGSGLLLIDPEVREYILLALEKTLPACQHRGRDGQESMCPSDYPVEFHDAKKGREQLFRKRATGFESLITRLRTAGKK